MIPSHRFTMRLRRRVLIAAMLAAIGAAPAPSAIQVKGDVDMKSDKSPLADPVETVPANTTLTVLDQNGGWIHVQAPDGKTGYISQDDAPVDINVAAVTGSGDATNLNSTASIKGNQVEDYAKQRNLKLDGLHEMISVGDSVSAKDLREFAKAGHVGPAKYRN